MSREKHRGLFIVFEGLDGSGKSTQSRLLKERLEKEGYVVSFGMEPSERPIGKLIRAALKGEEDFPQASIAALFAADRIDHLLQKDVGVIDRVSRGEIVLSDRYVVSSLAYNSLHNELEWVDELNRKALEVGLPDIQFYMDLSLEKCFERLESRNEAREIYEKKELLNRVYNNYMNILERSIWKNITKRIDTSLGIEQTHELIYGVVKDYIQKQSK